MPEEVAVFGDGLELDRAAYELRRAGRRVKLERIPMEILFLLVERRGQLVSREEIIERVWGKGVFLDTDTSINSAIRKIRQVLKDDPEHPAFIETVTGKGYRFIAALEPSPVAASVLGSSALEPTAVSDVAPEPTPAPPGGAKKSGRPRWPLVAVVALLLLAGGVAGFWYLHRSRALTEKDSIVLADFSNSTGDPVFDVTLRQGLAVQLEQSPFLSLVSDGRIQQTLRLMDKPADVRLTSEVAQEVCVRTGSGAVLSGAIAQIGTQYLLTLKAARCSSGELLASTEARASDKDHVLDALGKLGSDIRNKLGESLTTEQRFNTPLEQATTPSLEALQAYSLGHKAMSGKGDWFAAVPFFQRAISLDPNFAMAYARLGQAYRNLGEAALGAQNEQKAFQLRENTTESERFYIESHYYVTGTADLEKGREVLELWTQTYPRDYIPRSGLADIYTRLGQHEKALAEALESARLDANGVSYALIVDADIDLNRLEEAASVGQEAQEKRSDSPLLHFLLYRAAFLRNDASGMAQQVAWATDKPGAEDVLFELEARTKAYFGQLKKARELSRRAEQSAMQREKMEVAAGYQADAALREALFGNTAEARLRAAAALDLSKGQYVEFESAIALALAGDAGRARSIADDLARRFPEDTTLRFNYLPTIRARLALSSNHSSEALDTLQTAKPYELGRPVSISAIALYPVYVRGEAYLTERRGAEAAGEFQRVIDYRGLVDNSPLGALARLQLARAYALSGDENKARDAYQEFLHLWTDADSDIPILIQGKAEYDKLK